MITDMLVHVGIKKGDNYKVESLLELMEEHGVDQAMICSQLETIDNDYIHESALKYPGILLPFAVINPWDLNAEEELEDLFKNKGFYGLEMNAVRYGYSADRSSLIGPLFELCKKYNKIAVVHCMSDLFSLPDKWGKMAKAFPTVPILLYHFGVPTMADRAIELARELDNVYLSTAGAFPVVMQEAYKELGPEKIIFSSDAPYGNLKTEIAKIRFLTDNEEHLEMMFSKNIRKILKID